jgi:hypothetical protein
LESGQGRGWDVAEVAADGQYLSAAVEGVILGEAGGVGGEQGIARRGHLI